MGGNEGWVWLHVQRMTEYRWNACALFQVEQVDLTLCGTDGCGFVWGRWAWLCVARTVSWLYVHLVSGLFYTHL